MVALIARKCWILSCLLKSGYTTVSKTSALNVTCILSQDFRRKEAAWREKRREDEEANEAAVWKMLVAERQGGGSGDSGAGGGEEELKIEQEKYEQHLVSVTAIQARRPTVVQHVGRTCGTPHTSEYAVSATAQFSQIIVYLPLAQQGAV